MLHLIVISKKRTIYDERLKCSTIHGIYFLIWHQSEDINKLVENIQS